MSKLYPLLFEPVLKDYVWGGHRLAEVLGRDLPPGDIAESWEIAAHPNGTTAVANGRFAGLSLTQLQDRLGLGLIGRRNAWALGRDKFPLLIKLLDANRPLSVQVHPDDAYAGEHEGNELGKSEMWVVLHAEPDAAIILGVNEGTTPQRFQQAIIAGNLDPYLHRIPLQTGDHVCVPAGSLHAILGGLVIAEIQQNSDTTYRVYDWNRNDPERPLHVEQSLDVIDFDQVEPALSPPHPIADANGVRRLELCRNRTFVVERVEMAAGVVYDGRCDGQTLEIWGGIDGSPTLSGGDEEVTLTAVRFCLLPAALGDFTVRAGDASTLLRVYTPA